MTAVIVMEIKDTITMIMEITRRYDNNDKRHTKTVSNVTIILTTTTIKKLTIGSYFQ